MRSMIFLATQISQSRAPVSFASTSSFTSLPTVSTRDHGIFTASLRFGPHARRSLLERRAKAGCTRIQSVSPPMSTWVMRGWLFSPTCIRRPLTLPIWQSSRSINFLSRTSRTRSISASNQLQRDGYQREHEGDHDDNRNDGVTEPAVAVFPEVDRIIHEKQEWHNGERKRRAGEGHGDHRHLDGVDAEHQRNGGEKDDDGVHESESRIFRRLQVFAPVPAKPLREEVRDREGEFEGGAEAREQHREREQVKAPLR